ncbi:MAG: beta-glucoside-specific PTS transporter subunit IIABC [Sporolactobacillus sp.]
MSYDELSAKIIDGVGGKGNVNSVVHCTTRLRFRLKDAKKANTDALENVDGVIAVVQSGGQYQVVIGNQVADVYDSLIKIGGFPDGGTVPDDYSEKKKMSPLDAFIDLVSSIFVPILGVLASAGMIKGFAAMFVAFGWLTTRSGTYIILYAIGDAFFYFLPIILGLTAAKKFHVDQFIGVAIGAVLCYPSIVALNSSRTTLLTLFKGTFFESTIHTTFLHIPVAMVNYTSSVIPIIVAIWFASYVQKWARKIFPDVVKTFLVPFFVLLIVVPITFLVIGPVSTWLNTGISDMCIGIYNFSPVLAGVFMAGLWQVLVMFGLHWGFVAIAMANLASKGYDPVVALSFTASFAQTGVILALTLQTKNAKTRALGIPAFISGIFGVTEPAIYGLSLPRKRPFILSCIAAAIGGGLLGFFGSKLYMVGGLGIFGIPSMLNPKTGLDMSFFGMLIAISLSTVLGFVFQFFFGRKFVDIRKEQSTPTIVPAAATATVTMPVESSTVDQTTFNKPEELQSPETGTLLALKDVSDSVFSSESMGKGIAIEPSEGVLKAPAAGKITVVFPTGHAIGMNTADGAELLMHIGMDTVQLNGKGFTTLVKQGETVSTGQPLVRFDIDAIKKAGYSVTTPIVITNSRNYHTVEPVSATGTVTASQTLLKLN